MIAVFFGALSKGMFMSKKFVLKKQLWETTLFSKPLPSEDLLYSIDSRWLKAVKDNQHDIVLLLYSGYHEHFLCHFFE